MTRGRHPARLGRRPRDASEPIAVEDLRLALAAGDRDGIRSMLHPDVVMIIDSGGRMPQSSTAVDGTHTASAELAALVATGPTVSIASINGSAGLVLERDGAVVAAVSVESRSGLLSRIWVVCNPDKLTHWNRRRDG